MAKINCNCGNVIVDQSDAIKWKARFIADQDYDEFLNVLDEPDSIGKRNTIHRIFHEVYQCSACLSLIVFRNGDRKGVFYKPDNQESSIEILHSTYGDSWKGFLNANYQNDNGTVFWYTNIDSGLVQNLTLEQTKNTYYEKLEKLEKLKILQSSFLTIHGEIEHKLTDIIK